MEVRECRFGYTPAEGEVSEDEVKAKACELPADVKEALTPQHKPSTLLGGAF